MRTMTEVRAEALKQIHMRRTAANVGALKRRDATYKAYPELKVLDDQITTAMFAAFGRAVRGEEYTTPGLERLKRDKLIYLHTRGISEDFATPFFTCRKCRDEGVLENGKECACYIKMIHRLTPTGWEDHILPEGGFRDNLLSVYPENDVKDKAKAVYGAGWNFVTNFDRADQADRSIYIHGPQGSGKSHLTITILNEIKSRGHSVLYAQISHIMAAMVEHASQTAAFRPDSERLLAAQYRMRHLTEVELLAIDDLGAEAGLQKFYGDLISLIDQRAAQKLSTIITSNLNLNDIATHYDKRLASRLGGFLAYNLTGIDLRISMRSQA